MELEQQPRSTKVVLFETDGSYQIKQLEPSRQYAEELGGEIRLVPHVKACGELCCYVSNGATQFNKWSAFLEQRGFTMNDEGLSGRVLMCWADRHGRRRDVSKAMQFTLQYYYRQNFEKTLGVVI